MRIKVCGITFQEQFDALVDMGIDMVGLNFYEKSKRFLSADLFVSNRYQTKVVGIFVNESLINLKSISSKYKLDYIQLHGDEDIAYCQYACRFSRLIKVIKVKDEINPDIITMYKPYVDYFLLDTYSTQHGGSGKKFNWELLKEIKTHKKLILSGGISLDDVELLKPYAALEHIWGVDINSQFEIGPGMKDLNKISTFQKLITQ